jgi:hypothetical protein
LKRRTAAMHDRSCYILATLNSIGSAIGKAVASNCMSTFLTKANRGIRASSSNRTAAPPDAEPLRPLSPPLLDQRLGRKIRRTRQSTVGPTRNVSASISPMHWGDCRVSQCSVEDKGSVWKEDCEADRV